jgi:hypothetical protein
LAFLLDTPPCSLDTSTHLLHILANWLDTSLFVGHSSMFVGHFDTFVAHFSKLVGHSGVFVAHFDTSVAHFKQNHLGNLKSTIPHKNSLLSGSLLPGKRPLSITSYSQLVRLPPLHCGGRLDRVDVGQDRPVSCCRQLQVQLRLASDM